METTINRKQTAFRLSTDLVKRLKTEAKKENRSLNNYVESVLMDVVYNEPNDETKSAIEEARSGKYAGTLDTNSFDAFMKSVKEISDVLKATSKHRNITNRNYNPTSDC